MVGNLKMEEKYYLMKGKVPLKYMGTMKAEHRTHDGREFVIEYILCEVLMNGYIFCDWSKEIKMGEEDSIPHYVNLNQIFHKTYFSGTYIRISRSFFNDVCRSIDKSYAKLLMSYKYGTN